MNEDMMLKELQNRLEYLEKFLLNSQALMQMQRARFLGIIENLDDKEYVKFTAKRGMQDCDKWLGGETNEDSKG